MYPRRTAESARTQTWLTMFLDRELSNGRSVVNERDVLTHLYDPGADAATAQRAVEEYNRVQRARQLPEIELLPGV